MNLPQTTVTGRHFQAEWVRRNDERISPGWHPDDAREWPWQSPERQPPQIDVIPLEPAECETGLAFVTSAAVVVRVNAEDDNPVMVMVVTYEQWENIKAQMDTAFGMVAMLLGNVCTKEDTKGHQ